MQRRPFAAKLGVIVLPALLMVAALAAAPLAQGVLGGPAPSSTFYDPPNPLPPGNNGDVIRSEPSAFYLDPARTMPANANVWRVMYRTTNAKDVAIAVTGTVLVPKSPWFGFGARPLVAYAVGTQGLADKCAPSRQLSGGSEYEGTFIRGLLERGYAVVVTDYEGLGTPGEHTYMNRPSQAHAVLDSVRAAKRLTAAGLSATGPVALSGYSQGGGASAAAAELAATYAPELKIVGAYAGAPPADLGAVGKFLDGTAYVGFLFYAISGLDAAYPEDNIISYLNADGAALAEQVRQQCLVETLASTPFKQSKNYSKDGRPVDAYYVEEPFKSRLAALKIGNIKPAKPVLVIHSRQDDVVPYAQGRQMGLDWCAKGANVRFRTYDSGGHVATVPAVAPEVFEWLEARFAGVPAIGNCGMF